MVIGNGLWCMGVWVHGCIGVWVYVCMGVWGYGDMGSDLLMFLYRFFSFLKVPKIIYFLKSVLLILII